MKIPETILLYGDPDYRGDCPKEALEQATFFNRLRADYPQIAAIALHPKNEGKRTQWQVTYDKSQGMKTGAVDVIIPAGPALVIEIKRRDHTKSKWQEGQLDYLGACQELGAVACLALGADAAEEAIKEWLKNHHS